MKPLRKFLGLTRHLFQRSNLGLPATLMLAVSACGPMPEGEEAAGLHVTTQQMESLDVDECATGAHNCSIHATCTNTAEGFTCACNTDFAGDGVSCSRVSHTVALEPVADATVRYASPDTNSGTAHDFRLGPAWGGYMPRLEEAYLRFDLGSLPANARVKSVKLQATAYTGWAWGGDGNVYTYLVPDDTWSETGITFNNRPAVSGTALGFWWLWYDWRTVDQVGVNADPALAAAVRGELAGDKKLSVRLSSPGYITYYRSREYADATKRPKLFVTYDLVKVIEPVADATVSAGSPYSNFGTSQELLVEPAWFSPGMRDDVFLRFDLSEVPGSAQITSAELKATAYTGYAWGGDGNVYTHLVQDDTWSETGITWANQPAASGTHQGFWWLWYDNRFVDSLGVNASAELAATVKSEFHKDRKLSLRLHSPGYRTNYRSREYADANKRPQLTIAYVEPEYCAVEPGAPTLVLNGPGELTLECGVSTWVDPGARASDACGAVEVHRYNSGGDAYGPGPNTGAEGSYSVQYIAWNRLGLTTSAIRTVHVNDSTAPSLSLKGAATMTHTCGSQFVDPGVEAMDACYGDVSAQVRTTGDVNGWVEGTYTVRYELTDSGGNSATPVTRTVQVIDCPW